MNAKRFSISALIFLSAPSFSADISWNGTAGGTWTDTSRWSVGRVPGAGDNATINGAGLFITGNTLITADNVILNGKGSLSFFDTASAGNTTYNLTGVLTGSRPGLLSNYIIFFANATAGSATINVKGIDSSLNTFSDAGVTFSNTANAAQSVINNSHEASTSFSVNASAGQANITNDVQGMTSFYANSTAGTASITNNSGGYTVFSTLGNTGSATVVNNAGGVLDIANASSGVTLGALSGAGNVYLGANTLTVGSSNLSSTVSGEISDGMNAVVRKHYTDSNVTIKSNQTGGSLVKTGAGVLVLAGNNSYSGGTTLKAGTVQISQDTNLGSVVGALTFDGGTLATTQDLTLSRLINVSTGGGQFVAANGSVATLSGALAGAGNLSMSAGKQTLLNADSSGYSGILTLTAGNLNVDGALGGSLVAQNGTLVSGEGEVGNVQIDDGAALTVGSLASSAIMSEPSQLSVNGSLTNNGMVSLSRSHTRAGSALTVSGDYQGGSNSVINLNTALGDDSSTTDLLSIAGDSSGSSTVYVTNAGGTGAKTIEGIEVISVAGQSNANFIQGGRIVAGAYDYFLHRGEGTKDKNWYLTSSYTPQGTSISVTPEVPTYRPELASYTANQAAANTLFVHQLNDREGGATYVDPQNGPNASPSLWLRQSGGHTRFSDSSNQLDTIANRYVVQLGGSLVQGSFNGEDHWNAGIMAGYGNVSSHSTASPQGYSSRGSVDGYSTGIYATWYQNAAKRTGLYVDTWGVYSWFNNSVNGQGLPSEDYDSSGLTGSIETGYAWQLTDSPRSALYFQPQAQLVYMGVNADNVTEVNGTQVQSIGQDNVQTRLGARLFIRGHSHLDDNKDREFSPFVEANWIHNTNAFGTRMNGVSDYQNGARNMAEMKMGVEGFVTLRVNLWGGVGVRVGDEGYSDTMGQIGVKYRF